MATGDIRLTAQVLVSGTGQGRALVLSEPISLWGGLDPKTGEIIDRRHAQFGALVTGRILVMPCGRGSSSASSILLEAVRAGTAPAAIILAEPDAILALGAAVAREMYDKSLPILVLDENNYSRICDGQLINAAEDGTITILAKDEYAFELESE